MSCRCGTASAASSASPLHASGRMGRPSRRERLPPTRRHIPDALRLPFAPGRMAPIAPTATANLSRTKRHHPGHPRMQTITHLLLPLAALCTPVLAQAKPRDDMNAKPRTVAPDLTRLVPPTATPEN